MNISGNQYRKMMKPNIETNADPFQMFCQRCGKLHEIGPSGPVPRCDCGGELDFEKKEQAKCQN